MKKIVLILAFAFVSLVLCGCNIRQINILGDWTIERNGEETAVIIEKDKIIIDDESFEYRREGNWLFVDEEYIVIYIIDENNIVAVEGSHFTR